MIKTSARILALCCLILAFSFLAGAEETNPVANPNAVVTCGNARFTVLTDRLIRMEWSADGKWEDRATLAVINRDLPVPEFTTDHNGDGVTIKTNKVTLRYDGNGKFNAGNLKVSFGMNGKEVTWKPGDNDKGNLMGTTRSLDGCEGFDVLSKVEKELEKGILSRDGWAIVDESSRHVLVKDDSDWGEWVDCREDGDRQDLYIFAYGHDYKAALADFTKVAGKIPMPPKFTFGYWWSRFWAYTDTEMLDLAKEMRKREIPIDVFIIDMDWHELSLGIQARYGNDEFG
ncbi:MAG: DUF4968 domain-containing protein, partial [Bacteroidales bacterium]|nr:DUF4968 domain-containing protein [Candidatus Sodaliphilus aphodohippi]